MDTTAYVALSRAVSLDRQMTIVAGNLANAGTSGFIAERSRFETYLERAGEPRRVAFVQEAGTIRDPAPAPVIQTGSPLDIAILGDGYFTVETPAGPRYTRAGHFMLDAEGRIAMSGGALLLDEDGAAIELGDDRRPITIAEDGTISNAGGVLARIQPVSLPMASLRHEGSNLFASAAEPEPAVAARVQQGAVLGSNVQPIFEMTRLIETQRAFESSARLMETHHDLVRRTIEGQGPAAA